MRSHLAKRGYIRGVAFSGAKHLADVAFSFYSIFLGLTKEKAPGFYSQGLLSIY